MWVAESGDAACLRDWVNVVEQGSAAQGLVGDVAIFEGTDERASQRRYLGLGHEVTGDAGAGLAARPKWRPRQKGRSGGNGTGW